MVNFYGGLDDLVNSVIAKRPGASDGKGGESRAAAQRGRGASASASASARVPVRTPALAEAVVTPKAKAPTDADGKRVAAPRPAPPCSPARRALLQGPKVPATAPTAASGAVAGGRAGKNTSSLPCEKSSRHDSGHEKQGPGEGAREDRLRDSGARIKKALSELFSAGKDRSEWLMVNVARNRAYEEKESLFSGLKSALMPAVPTAVIGNNVNRASKRNELETAVRELDVKNKCALIYDEKRSIEYYAEHETVLLQMAVHFFSRNNNTKCHGLSVEVKASEGNGCLSKIVVRKDKTGGASIFEIRGVPQRLIKNTFETKDARPSAASENVRPSERIDLDTTKAAASQVFSTLRRLDPGRKLYLFCKTFYQKKKTATDRNTFRWTEVVGWDESLASRQAVRTIKPCEDDVFFLPASFQQMAGWLSKRYSDQLFKKASSKSGKRFYRINERLINPQIDSANEYKKILKDLDDCLDILLALGKNSSFTKSTVVQYRGKFRRYAVYCFALYALNKERHRHAVSPLPFNFFNLFSYMYSHGKDLQSSSFLATLTFLQKHLFAPMPTATPAIWAKRLLDVDFSILRGAKGGGVRDFGSPVKTSIHTRTLVSYLGYAEMAVASTASLLSGEGRRLSQTLSERVAGSLERWCDSLLFLFFTFVMFHRFSGVKNLSLESALRLTMGQTHAHVNKVRAAKRIRISNEETGHGEAGLTLSHPHILGLPFSVQAAIGVPVSELNPLMTPTSGSVRTSGSPPGPRYALGNILGLADVLPRGMPGEGEAAGNLGMFENLIKEMIDDYYGEETFAGLVKHAKGFMERNTPYDMERGLLLSRHPVSPGGAAPTTLDKAVGKARAFSRDVHDYLAASPMKLVFIIVQDSSGRERFLSIGDLALIAIWCKVRILNRSWDAPALSPSNYEWIGSRLCKHLLLADLANFGTWGDLKIVNKLDTNTETFHRDNERLPTAAEQKKLVKITNLNSRKHMALLHSQCNVRTRTHLGRVSATSWAVDALRTFTKGDKDTFASLAASLDLHHLGHTNSANFVPYFSKNYSSNEQEMGLWGYVRRTSEKVAKEELSKGRLGGLDKVGLCASNVAGAAIAVSSTIDMGEQQAVLDEAAKARKASGAVSTDSAKVFSRREAARAEGVRRLVEKTGSKSGGVLLLKHLWSFFAEPAVRIRLMAGEAVPALCPRSGFLHAAVPDLVFAYEFEKPSSFFRARMRFLETAEVAAATQEGGGGGGDDNDNGAVDRGGTEKKRKKTDGDSGSGCSRVEESVGPPRKRRRNLVEHNRDAVLSLDDPANVLTFDRLAMVDTEAGRQRLIEQNQQSMIAARVRKVCNRKGAAMETLEGAAAEEELLRDLEGIAYLG